MSELRLIGEEELEQRKTRLFEELSEVGRKQKALAREVYAVEKEQRVALKGVPEPVYEGPLTQRQVEEWAASRFFRYAKTAPANPHAYTHREWCDSEMFSRVVEFIRANGYDQRYGGTEYRCLDLDLPGGRFYVWTMGAPLEDTIILNRKPDSLRPEGG
ncbi:MAG: hypothetical protein M3518_05700 [Actinomycetota bacterium]|nr:hypothetical protein [Actinomycetota bacterium]